MFASILDVNKLPGRSDDPAAFLRIVLLRQFQRQPHKIGFPFGAVHLRRLPQRAVQEGFQGAAQRGPSAHAGNGHPLHE